MKTINCNNSNNETTAMNFISQFEGSYHAHVNGKVIPCQNLESARTQINGAKEHAIVNCKRNPIKKHPTIDCIGFEDYTGEYYVVVCLKANLGNGVLAAYDVKIDCDNKRTFYSLMCNGVSFTTVAHALSNPSNVRENNGWFR